LSMTTVALGELPRAVQTHTVKGASQGETRSHGFFFQPDEDGAGGVLGLPMRKDGSPGWWQLFTESAEVSFVRVSKGLEMKALGALEATGGTVEDQCEVSCADWYGNSRPIFDRGRVFALMGYELVEGKLGAE